MPGFFKLWALPGFMGTELTVPFRGPTGALTGPRLRIWLDAVGMARGRVLPLLRYPQDPSWPVRAEAYTNGVSNNWLPRCTATRLGLLDFGQWRTTHWFYDWRRPVREIAADFADELEAQGGEPGTHFIVGHSLGGLIAMAAWALLKAQGRENLIGRIVTLASPLYGCYAPARARAGFQAAFDTLAMLADVRRRLVLSPVGAFLPDPGTLLSQMREILPTWPSLYDLLPDPARGDDAGDAHRSLLWDAASWTYAPLPPNWALSASSVTSFHQWIRQPANIPPANIARHIYGRGVSTPWRLQPPRAQIRGPLPPGYTPSTAGGLARLQSLLPGWEYTDEGDGTVTAAQAKRDGYYSFGIDVTHDQLPMHDWVWERMRTWLWAEGLDLPAELPAAPVQPAERPRYRRTPPYTAIAASADAEGTGGGRPTTPATQSNPAGNPPPPLRPIDLPAYDSTGRPARPGYYPSFERRPRR